MGDEEITRDALCLVFGSVRNNLVASALLILDASERVISPGTFRMRSVVARNTRHYTPPSQKLSGQTTAEANMTRREGGEAQMRRFMDRGRNIKPTRFVDAELDKPWSDEMKALAEKIMEKWETRPRTWQGQVMDCVIQGRDVLVRAGTGAGKSLCFQALALLRPGAIVLVVSPLVGLMENQVIQPFWYISDSGRCWTFDRDPEINQFQKVFHMIYAHKESIFEAKIDKILKFLEYMQSVNIRY